MKSVGEVMAIGRNFEEALQKAIRMLDIGANGLVCNDFKFENLKKNYQNQPKKEFLQSHLLFNADILLIKSLI